MTKYKSVEKVSQTALAIYFEFMWVEGNVYRPHLVGMRIIRVLVEAKTVLSLKAEC